MCHLKCLIIIVTSKWEMQCQFVDIKGKRIYNKINHWLSQHVRMSDIKSLWKEPRKSARAIEIWNVLNSDKFNEYVYAHSNGDLNCIFYKFVELKTIKIENNLQRCQTSKATKMNFLKKIKTISCFRSHIHLAQSFTWRHAMFLYLWARLASY